MVLAETVDNTGNVAVARRSAATNYRIVVKIKSSALNRELLAASLRAASAAQRQGGTVVEVYIPERTRLRAVDEKERERVDLIMSRMLAADPIDVPGVSRARAITVDISSSPAP